MSFSQDVKNELAKLPLVEDEILSEAAAMVRMNGTVKFSLQDRLTVEFVTENNPSARRIFSMMKSLYDYDSGIFVKKNPHLQQKNQYVVVLEDSEIAKRFLKDVGITFSEENFGIEDRWPQKLWKKETRRRAYLRGAFLGAGSISNPQKNYHLEMVCRDQTHARRLIRLMNEDNLGAKSSLRGEDVVVYIKEAEKISDFLAAVGAHYQMLEFENVRVIKDMRNTVNRLVNCETANLDKTVNTALQQVEWIEFIQEKGEFEKLPPELQTLCRLRLENRSLSLKELGEKMVPPISKSAVRYRFAKIKNIAEDLGYR